jgi:hypothetical protein
MLRLRPLCHRRRIRGEAMTDRKPPALFRATLEVALVQLLSTLKEAQAYLDTGQDLAAIGTLIALDEQVADLNAALRLYRRNQ